MEENKPKMYLSDIHLENYTDQYEGKQATVADAVFIVQEAGVFCVTEVL